MKYTHTKTVLPIESRYPKLVRDKIPAMIERDGKVPHYHREDDDVRYLHFLLTKLLEEATELREAVGLDHQKEELADVREVLASIQEALGVLEDEIDRIQTSKRDERGGFGGRLILDSHPE